MPTLASRSRTASPSPAADAADRASRTLALEVLEQNRYSRIIVDEARRRGIAVEVVDAERGEIVLSYRDRSVHTIQSLSELTSAVAFRRCDDKRHTREVLEQAGLRVAPGRTATFDARDVDFLHEHGEVVVKPARGEAGSGITVGVTDVDTLGEATAAARRVHPDVLLERRVHGDDLRILVIDREVVAASVRRPPVVTGDGTSRVRDLVTALSEQRALETDGAAHLPLDGITRAAVEAAGHGFDDVLPAGEVLQVRGTANVHTGGTIDDVTDDLHPELAAAAVRAADAIEIPVIGVDLIAPDVAGPYYVIIEGNEQPGLANHEPRPTAERFIDLLFPETTSRARPPRPRR